MLLLGLFEFIGRDIRLLMYFISHVFCIFVGE